MIPKIDLSKYSYALPPQLVANYPLFERDQSKLLYWRNYTIEEHTFKELPNLLPKGSMAIFNNSKVFPARLFFRKASGAKVEIFTLKPYNPIEITQIFSSKRSCSWISIVGNIKRWRGEPIYLDGIESDTLSQTKLTAQIEGRVEDKVIIQFNWEGNRTFGEIIELYGKVPIPPYLKRESEEIDKLRYQTVYARAEGSVAAPTAGLHFTSNIFKRLIESGINIEELQLHVGAGTFLPIGSPTIEKHQMHQEPLSISVEALKRVVGQIEEGGDIIAVGTTSLRTLESLYLLGLKVLKGEHPTNVEQWEWCSEGATYSAYHSLSALLNWMERNGLQTLSRETKLMIVPGYQFKVVDILITNFHQPGSTLLLLIAAFIGEEWRELYNFAIERNFRFLSYGDSSILYKNRGIEAIKD
ncbi:MAG: S-adenosylmethionine:tRNA ribosyltransferase-isomerase [Bacteroidales bacterium]